MGCTGRYARASERASPCRPGGPLGAALPSCWKEGGALKCHQQLRCILEENQPRDEASMLGSGAERQRAWPPDTGAELLEQTTRSPPSLLCHMIGLTCVLIG